MKLGGSHKGGFQKSAFGRCSWTPKTGVRGSPKAGTRVQKNATTVQKLERGHICQNHPFLSSRETSTMCEIGILTWKQCTIFSFEGQLTLLAMASMDPNL